MLHRVYDALWYPALPFALIAAGGIDAANRRERLGYTASIDSARAPRIWIHASSVGEIEAIRPVASGLMQEWPSAALLVTTMTIAGREAARVRIAGAGAATLAPLDSPRTVRRFLSATRPHLVLIAETELWPNYFIESKLGGARVAIVNGRISERSMRRYALARRLFACALESADAVLVQTEADASRYRRLGAPPDRVAVTGNTKFEIDSAPAPLRPELEAFARGRPILIAGSTAPGEDAVVIEAYQRLIASFPELALVIAPRHLERVAEVVEAVRSANLAFVRASAGDAGSASLMILDTMGELRAMYRRAAIAFVGGSIVRGRGGQNPAEAASAGVPVLIGPYHENQREIVSAMVDSGGAFIVRDAAEIATSAAKLLHDESARAAAGAQARETIEKAAGGTRATLMRLKPLITLA